MQWLMMNRQIHKLMKPFFIKHRSIFLLYTALVIASFAVATCGTPPTPIIQPLKVEIVSLDTSGNVSTPTEEPTDPPAATKAPEIEPTAEIPPIDARWKIKYFECNSKGQAVSVTIDLVIWGGVSPYTTDPKLPFFAMPGEDVSILVKSATADGEPSRRIVFPVPPRASYNCKQQSRESEYQPVSTDSSTPGSGEPTKDPCENNGGHKPPGQCNK